MKEATFAIAAGLAMTVAGSASLIFTASDATQHEPQVQQVRPWVPSEGHCKQARYIMSNTRYYTSSDLRMAKQIVERCEELEK